MVATLTQLVANLAPLVKRVSHNGRDYLVAPASLIVPGVLNGSDGAGYYPPEENAKSASAWDGMPLVAYHPLRNGQPVAAQDPEHKEWVWANSGLGHLRNTRNNGKLTSEAWFDEELVKNYDKKLPEHVRIHPRLVANRPIELSTGLMLDKEVKNGTCPRTGKPYDWVARNYQPDHLAVLPDQRGACSNEDGCGIVVNVESEGQWLTLPNGVHIMVKDGKIVHGPKGLTKKEKSFFSKESVKKATDSLEQGKADLEKAVKDRDSVKNAGKHGNPQHAESGQYLPHGSGTGKGENHAAAVESHKNVPASQVEEDGEDDGAPLDNCTSMPMTKNSNRQGDQTMTVKALKPEERTSLLTKLVTNCKCSDEDRGVLNTLSDATLLRVTNAFPPAKDVEPDEDDLEEENMPKKKLPPQFAKNQETTTVTPVQNAKPQTAKEWMDSAPPEIREVVTNALKVDRKAKEQLIQRLVSNKKDEEKAKYATFLSNKSLDELETLVELMPTPVANASDGLFDAKGNVAPVFVGANGGYEGVRNSEPVFNVGADPEMDPQWHFKQQQTKATAGSAA